MNFEINVEKLVTSNITIEQYFFCQFIYHNNQSLFDDYLRLHGKFYTRDTLDDLVSKEFIELRDQELGYRFSNIKVSNKFIDYFDSFPIIQKAESEDLENWFDSWYELFPKGVKNGNYLIRSGKAGCIKKLKKFIKEYPEYTKDIVMRATEEYVAHCRVNRWAYMQLAQYFIEKEGMSNLASRCEDVLNRRTSDGSIEDSNKDAFTRTLN